MKKMIACLTLILSLVAGLIVDVNAQKPQTLAFESEVTSPVDSAADSNATFFEVGAGSVRYHTYHVTAGERIRIELRGDGDTDLDMYVYSPGGSLIDEQASYSDDESSYFTSYRSGTLTVKIVNCGNVYNRYSLSVWGN